MIGWHTKVKEAGLASLVQKAACETHGESGSCSAGGAVLEPNPNWGGWQSLSSACMGGTA